MIYLIIILGFIQCPCPDTDGFCRRCGGDRCLNCVSSFANSSGICVAVNTKIVNCITYEDENTCLECELGYSVTEDGQCQEISLSDCLQLDPNGDCRYCKEGKLMKNGTCSTDDCKIGNCAVCSNYFDQAQCMLCQENFVVYPYQDNDGFSQTKCVHENGRTVGCQIARFENETDCLLCKINYYYSEGKCIKSQDYYLTLKYSFVSLLTYGYIVMMLIN